MVSRTAVAAVALLALALGVQCQNPGQTTDGSTSTQNINKVVPQTTLYTSIAVANVGITPSTPAIPVTGRKMLATFNAAATITAEFNTSIVQYTAARSSPPFTFVGEAKEQLFTEIAEVDYIFGTVSMPFLKKITTSGTTFQFLRALIYTPQETNPVPFVSDTGFLNADGSTFVAKISTTAHTIFVPNVAVRFDYQLTGTSPTGAPVSPFVSIYYSDRINSAAVPPATPSNPNANLKTNQGVYIDQQGNVLPGGQPAGTGK